MFFVLCSFMHRFLFSKCLVRIYLLFLRAKVHRWVAQPGLFAKCHDHVALYILDTCVIFLRLYFSQRFIIAFLFSFIALYHSAFIFFHSALSQRFYFFSQRFIIALLFSFMALYHSAFIFFQSTLSQRFYFLSKHFYSIFLSASKCLFFILNASQRLFFILLSMKQCPISFSNTSFSSCFNFWMCKHTIS